MATTDQPALSVFHEITGDRYRLTIAGALAIDGKPLTTTVEMTTQSAHELARAILATLNDAERNR